MATVVPPNPLPPDESVGGILLTLTSVLTAFTIATTVMRVWARIARRAMGLDDYIITICMVLAIVRTGIQIDSVKRGNGRHRWYLSKEDYEYVNFLTWLTQIFLFSNIGLLKCSICILILRIKNEKKLRWFLYAMMIGLVLTNLECILVLLAQCDPVKKYWHPSAPGKCWPTKVRIYSIYLQVAYSVVTDLICALLPIVVLWNVRLTPKVKAGVCGLMSLGLIATAAAIVRASSLGTKTVDLSYDYCIAAIWANTELHLGIIATNLSLSRMIWAFFWGGTKSLTSRSRSHATGSTPRYGTGSRISRNGYIKSHDRSVHTGDSAARGSMDNFSQASQIPLDPVIKKTTNVYVSSEPSPSPNASSTNQESKI
ncbi:hypothetical protein K458DRAFT_438484 [Lentithecium fluviatile CBS 122367]|uniref:Rhodopsin domain-containing protein n=1 Tax=Lentithecium fluviatile CBS 122367 TaxID=1168545 RepID=A0A6G1JJ62_9PLEO|nr:hypothetical protein K458DRAFT_438484 [Lentithecium fluviatile CBS 122367]